MQQRTKQIQLAWSASSDNVAVAGYRISRNGVVVGTSSTTSWFDTNWVTGSTYTYSVVAYDAAGNVSLPSNSVSVTVAAGGKKK
jgi:chitodextrinase